MMEPIKLSQLLVYNSTFGPNEGEEEKKVLYFFPDEEKQYAKINDIGLCEALVQFTRTLSPGMPCQYLHTQRHHYVFDEPEEQFWMVMVLSNPVVAHGNGKKEVKEHEITDSVYHAVLKQLYQRFRFLHGTFLHISQMFSVDELRKKLRVFFQEFIPSLNLKNCDLLNVFNGLSYCILEKSNLLGFQSFICSLQDKFKNIKYSLILCDHRIVASGLSKDDTQVVVKLVREKLLLDLPFSKRFKLAANNVSTIQLNNGRFIKNMFANSDNTVFISVNSGKMEQMHLVVYQAFSITSCYFLDHLTIPFIDMCKQLDAFIGPQLASLAAEIPARQKNNLENLEPNMKHIYFNKESLAIESTCHSVQAGVSVCSIPGDVMHILNDINGGFGSSLSTDEEVIDKVHSDHWVASKKTNQKELHIVVNNKNANLIGVNDDIRKMSSHFDNLLFSD